MNEPGGPAITVQAGNYQVSVDNQFNIVTLKMFGVIRLKELVDSFSELVRHPHFKINMSSCYDLSEATVDIDLNKTEIFYHFAAAMREKRGDNYLLAFVYGDELTKMLGEYYQLFLARADVEVKSFSDLSKANEWLRA